MSGKARPKKEDHDITAIPLRPSEIVVGGRAFHVLFPDLLRPLTPDERARLRAAIALRGVLVAVIVDEQDGIIVGLSLAGKAAEAYRLNADRRQLSEGDRQAAALRLRSLGMSYRAIAEAQGVGKSTVQRDIVGAPVPSGTPDLPPAVEGRDGKHYPASRPREEAPLGPEPRPPYNRMLRNWLNFVRGQTFYIEAPVEGGGKGGLAALLAERDRWDWEDVREQLLPDLEGLRDTIEEYIRRLRDASEEG
jgi:hypothetical protein